MVRLEVGNEKFSRDKIELFDARRELFLMGKIMRFEFSEKDWKRAKLILMKNGTLGKVLKNAERFGELSEEQIIIFARKMMLEMEGKNGKLGVMVNGGYRSEGVMRELSKSGANVIEVRPMIDDKIGNLGNPLAIFRKDQRKLEDLFERKEVIHLAPNLKFVNKKNEVMEGLMGVLKKLYSEVGADGEIEIIGKNTIEESGRKWKYE